MARLGYFSALPPEFLVTPLHLIFLDEVGAFVGTFLQQRHQLVVRDELVRSLGSVGSRQRRLNSAASDLLQLNTPIVDSRLRPPRSGAAPGGSVSVGLRSCVKLVCLL